MRNTYMKKGEWNTKERRNKKQEATEKREKKVEMVMEKETERCRES